MLKLKDLNINELLILKFGHGSTFCAAICQHRYIQIILAFVVSSQAHWPVVDIPRFNGESSSCLCLVLRNAVAHNLLHRDLCSISYDCPQQQKLKASCHVDYGQHGMTESSAEHFANPYIENFRDGSKKVQICLVGIWRDIFPATVFQTVLNGPKQRFDEVENLWECNSVDIT